MTTDIPCTFIAAIAVVNTLQSIGELIMAKTPKKIENTQTSQEITAQEENKLPSYLQRVVDNIPQGGDGGVVYAGDYGWVCEYKDGTKELLEELTGLAGTLRRYGLDKFGKPMKPGTVVSTDITVEVLLLLDINDLKTLAEPLGIVSTDRNEIIAQLTEKLQIK
ncbi:hypothetical protein [Salmonella phage FrontPhageNews]|nr:hypothetical protein [Salmonella enterica]QPX74143.1 hypothetical protein [Salmonella phage AR2819]QPX74185.1 hypothetical protein [Salmonella phage FrontPhageNews]QPX74643.1 hypothetical protein Sajous1_85 [Salmonella phage Sajous1]UYL83624.1 hypothetical protein GUERRERO_5 [Salmonella phage Guerrero]